MSGWTNSHFNWDIKVLGVKLGDNLKLDTHVPDIFRKVGRKVNILPLRLTSPPFFSWAKSGFIVEPKTLSKLKNVNEPVLSDEKNRTI